MTEQVTDAAQNTEAAATQEGSGAAPADATQEATLMGGDTPAEAEQQANGNEGNEGDAPSDEDPSKQDEKTDTKDSEPEGAPEEYEDFSMPEGVELDAEATGELKDLAKELNLSQKDAQRIADLGAKQAAKLAEQPAQVLAEASQEWEQATKNDKELGGTMFNNNMATAKKAMDAFGSPELKGLLNESKLGNHPEVARFMFRVGKAMSEDTIVRGHAGDQPAKQSAAQRLYGNNN